MTKLKIIHRAKKPVKKFPALRDMLVIFFSGQHDDFGTSLEEIMKSYIDYDVASEQVEKEIAALLQIEDDSQFNLIMTRLAEDQFRPKVWGETWRSFLIKVQLLLEK